MKNEELLRRVVILISLADQTLATEKNSHGGTYVSSEKFAQLRSGSLAFFKSIFGTMHPFFEDFSTRVNQPRPSSIKHARGILTAAKEEIEHGWLYSVKQLVAAEIFSDYLEMAEHLLQQGYKDAAAVMVGSTLEEHLRQLCSKNEIPITSPQDPPKPKRADGLNADLAAKDVYGKLDQKSVTSWLGFRNSAAHGLYEQYSKEQIDLMLLGVTDFIARTGIGH